MGSSAFMSPLTPLDSWPPALQALMPIVSPLLRRVLSCIINTFFYKVSPCIFKIPHGHNLPRFYHPPSSGPCPRPTALLPPTPISPQPSPMKRRRTESSFLSQSPSSVPTPAFSGRTLTRAYIASAQHRKHSKGRTASKHDTAGFHDGVSI